MFIIKIVLLYLFFSFCLSDNLSVSHMKKMSEHGIETLHSLENILNNTFSEKFKDTYFFYQDSCFME
jgi:hypothetical protein